MQALKFRVGQTIRRDSVQIDQISFAALLTVFQDLFNRPLHNETLRYRDDESEWIDISSDRELREALRLNKDKTLELTTVRNSFRDTHVAPNSGSARARGSWGFKNDQYDHRGEPRHHHQHRENPFGHSNRANRFRHHAICDNCNNQIVGTRHKCNECLDYDLCSQCIEKSDQVHPGHTYTALARSFPRWHHRRPERQEAKEEAKQEETSVPAQNDENIPAATLVNVDQQENNEDTEQNVAQEQLQISSEHPPAPPAALPVQPLNGKTILETLQALAYMGFEDKQKNVRLILAHAGDMDLILEELFAE